MILDLRCAQCGFPASGDFKEDSVRIIESIQSVPLDQRIRQCKCCKTSLKLVEWNDDLGKSLAYVPDQSPVLQ